MPGGLLRGGVCANVLAGVVGADGLALEEEGADGLA